MKVAISSVGMNIDSSIDPRFGRCAYFIIYDTDNMTFEAFENESSSLGGGAGIQSAQFVASKGIKAVITGNCGPNAVKALDAGGIKLYTDQSGIVKEAVERLNNNRLKASQEANVPDHYGVKDRVPSGQGSGSQGPDPYFSSGMGSGRGMGGGRGMGMCGGKGTGRGMGGGRGKGQGMGRSWSTGFPEASSARLSREEELELLKKQSEELLRQVGDIQQKIEKLENE